MEAYADLFKSLKAVTKSSSVIAGRDINFHRTLEPEVGRMLDRCDEMMLSLASQIVDVSMDHGLELKDAEDVNDNWNELSDITDSLLERTHILIDEYTGVVNKRQQLQASNVTKTSKATPKRGRLAYKLQHAENIPRPQLNFREPPDNNATIFTPSLTKKPHALKSLEDSLRVDENSDNPSYPHPYSFEISQSAYPASIYEETRAQMYTELGKSDITFVDTVSALHDMLNEWAQCTEIAVDLEHHDYRSYEGFVCLMQASSRSKDWIIDTLALRDDLQVLNEVFADPKIIKVFHGAHMDIKWLQRDFGLYVVSLFDTFHASKVLRLAGHSLSFLLQDIAGFNAEKKYQLADWRIRPLPQEMLDYARSDTHFLLYIFDVLKLELLAVGTHAMEDVLNASRQVALQRFERYPYDAENGLDSSGWRGILTKYNIRFSNPAKQIPVMKALHFWRDRIARQEDESLRYVLPNHMLVALCNAMPSDIQGVLRTCNPVPPLTKLYAGEIVELIKRTQVDVSVVEQSKSSQGGPDKSLATSHKTVHRAAQPPGMTEAGQEIFKHPRNILQANSSGFWRPVDNGQMKDKLRERVQKVLFGTTLTVPLPQLSATIYESTKTDELSHELVEDDPGAMAHHPFISKKRKMDENKEKEEIVQLRPPSKPHNNPKKAKQNGKNRSSNEPTFDYDHASILVPETDRGVAPTSFDPYSKLHDDPFKKDRKKLKRVPLPGRSQTFGKI